MPIVNINVLNKKDKDSDPCQLMFVDPDDCGRISLDDVHIYTVFNAIDHFLGTENRIPTFRKGIDDIFNKLMEATNIASSLNLCTHDKTVQLTLNQAVDVIKSVGHNLNKMFIPMDDDDDDDSPVERHGTKKRRISKEPGQTRTKKAPLSALHCACGELFSNNDELVYHRQQKHELTNNWNCKKCEVKITTQKGLKRHTISQHLGYYLHYCLYCDYGRNEKHSVMSHMTVAHGMGQQYHCTKTENCKAFFSSLFKLNRHMKYCGEERNFSCNYCGHKFIREQNLNHHIKINHTHELSKVHCEYCQKDYATVNSYRQHFKKGNCKTFEMEKNSSSESSSSNSSSESSDGEGEGGNRDEDIQVASGVVYM